MKQGADWDDAEFFALRREGLAHLNRLLSGEATERDEVALRAWLAQGAAHREAWRSATRLRTMVRAAAQDLPVAAPVMPNAARREGPRRSVGRRRPAASGVMGRRMFLGGAVAASGAAVIAAGASLDVLPSMAELRADHRTAIGARELVRLAGGATIALNTRTSIRVLDGATVPAVELLAGEAILTSGHDARLTLLSGPGRSSGRGARWSARQEADETCVTCLAGSVEVAWRDERRTLLPNQQLRYDRSAISPTQSVDPEMVTAWQTGTLIFRSKSLREVVAEINRYRPGRIYIANDRLANRKLTGTYHVDRLDDFFRQSEMVLGLTVRRMPLGVVILA